MAKAKRNHSDNSLNCIEYAFRIKDIVPAAEIWEVGGKHAICIVKDEKGKEICYSNGKQVKVWAYSKIRRIQ